MYIERNGQNITDFVPSNSIKINTKRGGDRDTCSFKEIKNSYNTVIAPAASDLFEIYDNSGKTFNLYSGILQKPKKSAISKEDDEYIDEYTCQCSDHTADIDREPIATTWDNKTDTWIVRNLFQEWIDGGRDYDITGIDPTKGITLTQWKARQEYPTDIIDTLAKLSGVTWWISPDKKVYYNNDIPEVYAPFEINDDNIDDLTNDIPFEDDISQMANKIKFFYNTSYNANTIQVTLNSKIITGTNTEFLRKVKPGARLKVTGYTSEYTVESVDSNTQITLSSSYNEPSLTGLSYRIDKIPCALIVSDQVSIEMMKALRGNNGIYCVPLHDENSYTFEEAKKVAEAQLIKYSNQLTNFKFDIASSTILEQNPTAIPYIRAGMIVKVNLTKRANLQGELIINAVSMELGNGYHDEINFPVIKYTVDFTDRLYDMILFIQNMNKKIDKIVDTSDDSIVEEVYYGFENAKAIDSYKIHDTFINATIEDATAIDSYILRSITPIFYGFNYGSHYGFNFDDMDTVSISEDATAIDSYIIGDINHTTYPFIYGAHYGYEPISI